ncbi:MAG: hypothetical protein SFU99_18335 [Saprospiraceae bacterium]|nr:hypothetical protein [Saprospiraceae bacterium]
MQTKNLLPLLMVFIFCTTLQAQNVGIGTTLPEAKLHVNGNFLSKHQLGGFAVPTFSGLDFNKTLVQGVFFGEEYAPQLRFVTNSSGLFMDLGQDSSGNFIIRRYAKLKFTIYNYLTN